MLGRKAITLVVAGLLLPVFAPASSGAADKNAWRVDGRLIRIGDSMGRVLALAGEPDTRETLQEAVDIDGGETEKIVVWYYMNESKRKMHTIRFRDSRVSRIQWERY